MIDAAQLRRYVIRPALMDVGLWSEAAENLLMGTAAHESHMGTYIKQIKGPALGIYQMEPATADSLWEHFLRYRPGMLNAAAKMLGNNHRDEALIYNLRYATFMARIKYYADSNPLPHKDDVEGLAAYWKRVYNTRLGAGTVEQFIRSYHEIVLGK